MGTLSLIVAWLSAHGHPSKEDFLFTSPQEVLGFVRFVCLFSFGDGLHLGVPEA